MSSKERTFRKIGRALRWKDFYLFIHVFFRTLTLAGDVRAAPFLFDIRGGGGFWAIEFDFSTSRADFREDAFAMLGR